MGWVVRRDGYMRVHASVCMRERCVHVCERVVCMRVRVREWCVYACACKCVRDS